MMLATTSSYDVMIHICPQLLLLFLPVTGSKAGIDDIGPSERRTERYRVFCIVMLIGEGGGLF